MTTIDLSHITKADLLRAGRNWETLNPANRFIFSSYGNRLHFGDFRYTEDIFTGTFGVYLHPALSHLWLVSSFSDSAYKKRSRGRSLDSLDTPEVFRALMQKRGFIEAEKLAELYAQLIKFLEGVPDRGSFGDEENYDR